MRTLIGLIGIALLGACFHDDGGGPPGSGEDGSMSDDDSSSADDDTSGDGGDSDSDVSTSDDDEGSSDEGSSSASSDTGEPACTATSCPEGEFCVDGVCQEDPPPNMIVIEGGPFHRGCNGDADCNPDELPADPDLYVSVFAIDRTEVTTGDYQACVDADACAEGGIGEPECNTGRPGYEDHPINCVTWAQAEAYCAWAVKRLPTEAEWEKAARGDDARRYAWGADTPSCDLAVLVTDGYGCGTGETWPVGSKSAGASPYGILNVAGNVREWTADWYADTFETDVDDPTGPATGTERVSRGAALINGNNSSVRVGNRTQVDPTTALFYIGFRCAAG